MIDKSVEGKLVVYLTDDKEFGIDRVTWFSVDGGVCDLEDKKETGIKMCFDSDVLVIIDDKTLDEFLRPICTII